MGRNIISPLAFFLYSHYYRYVISQHMLLMTREVTQLQQKKSFLVSSNPEDSQQIRAISDRMETMNTCLRAMKNTMSSVQVMDVVQPVRVLGIKCEGRTAVVMVYTLFLFLIGLLQYAYFGSLQV
jgi:hypothetical protein